MRTLAILAITASASFGAHATDLPTFEQYALHNIYHGKPAPVRLSSHPQAKTFRTVLRDGEKGGPNFAGHYTVVTFGCGISCLRLAIVDARNGNVFFPPQTQPNSYFMVTDQSPPYEYRLDSELLILTGAPQDKDNEGIYYYRWDGKRLRQLAYVAKKWWR